MHVQHVIHTDTQHPGTHTHSHTAPMHTHTHSHTAPMHTHAHTALRHTLTHTQHPCTHTHSRHPRTQHPCTHTHGTHAHSHTKHVHTSTCQNMCVCVQACMHTHKLSSSQDRVTTTISSLWKQKVHSWHWSVGALLGASKHGMREVWLTSSVQCMHTHHTSQLPRNREYHGFRGPLTVIRVS